jgi:4-diphosphocytidyl-2-C-methyl-D-erythritol kinase
VISFPNGKINIGLKIIRKRPDAYHDLETIFYPIPLSDLLEFVPAPSLSFNPYGDPIPGELLDNICVSAYKLLKGEFSSLPPIAIHLLKKIPVAAGLGGGSSDAAFMLKMLNDYFRLGISEADLCVYASKLGSDCAFFVQNTPCFASGRGEILEPLDLDLSPYSLVLVKTAIQISTGWAFTKIKASGEPSGLLHSSKQPITEWESAIKNDFEDPVFRTYPLLRKIKQRLYEAGALYASMSGSGSCIYGFFKKNAMPGETFFADLSSEIHPIFIP